MPHLEAKIVDLESRIVPLEVTGELLIRGYSVIRRYWDDQVHTELLLDPAGWMHTGDLARFDADGFCQIVGRCKEMVIQDCDKIYPREIEDFLYSQPKIQEVHVFGVPDPVHGERLCAWIRLRRGEAMTEAEIIAVCRGRIADYKIPRQVRFVESFPVTATGKVQKHVMREIMTETAP